jgi:hypothetical protein
VSAGLRDLIVEIAPPWLRGGVAEKFLYSLGLPQDAQLEKLQQGFKAGMPGYGTPTALPIVGNQRRIIRGFQESDASYIHRLQEFLTTWAHAGSPYAILTSLAGFVSPAILTMRTVSPEGTWATCDDGETVWWTRNSIWDWDSINKYPQGLWFRFWTIIYAGSLWTTEGTWGDGKTWGDGGTWGSTMTDSQVQTIRAIVRQWKAAHNVQGPIGHNGGIIVSFDDTWFNPHLGGNVPDGTWGRWAFVVGGVYVASRTGPIAIYLDGPLPNGPAPPNDVPTI